MRGDHFLGPREVNRVVHGDFGTRLVELIQFPRPFLFKQIELASEKGVVSVEETGRNRLSDGRGRAQESYAAAQHGEQDKLA
jgi:hypothetical protein